MPCACARMRDLTLAGLRIVRICIGIIPASLLAHRSLPPNHPCRLSMSCHSLCKCEPDATVAGAVAAAVAGAGAASSCSKLSRGPLPCHTSAPDLLLPPIEQAICSILPSKFLQSDSPRSASAPTKVHLFSSRVSFLSSYHFYSGHLGALFAIRF